MEPDNKSPSWRQSYSISTEPIIHHSPGTARIASCRGWSPKLAFLKFSQKMTVVSGSGSPGRTHPNPLGFLKLCLSCSTSGLQGVLPISIVSKNSQRAVRVLTHREEIGMIIAHKYRVGTSPLTSPHTEQSLKYQNAPGDRCCDREIKTLRQTNFIPTRNGDR